MLDYVPPSDLQETWAMIRPGLEKVCKKSSDGWIPEDVYCALKAGTSTLHIGYVDGDYVGFLILTPMQGYDCKKLMIWCGYNAGPKNIVEQCLPEVEQMARQIGAKKIIFGSPRRWDRRMPDFKPVTTYYEKEV